MSQCTVYHCRKQSYRYKISHFSYSLFSTHEIKIRSSLMNKAPVQLSPWALDLAAGRRCRRGPIQSSSAHVLYCCCCCCCCSWWLDVTQTSLSSPAAAAATGVRIPEFESADSDLRSASATAFPTVVESWQRGQKEATWPQFLAGQKIVLFSANFLPKTKFGAIFLSSGLCVLFV